MLILSGRWRLRTASMNLCWHKHRDTQYAYIILCINNIYNYYIYILYIFICTLTYRKNKRTQHQPQKFPKQSNCACSPSSHVLSMWDPGSFQGAQLSRVGNVAPVPASSERCRYLSHRPIGCDPRHHRDGSPEAEPNSQRSPGSGTAVQDGPGMSRASGE